MNCSALRSVVIPDSVISIGTYAFRDCDYLKNVILSKSVETIEYGTFLYCKYMEQITIPNSVTTIKGSAFGYCSSLTRINYEGTIEQWCAIDKEVSSSSSWDYATGKYTVYCTDGTIAKDGTVTYK